MEEALEKALRMFSHYGYDQETLINKLKLAQILNKQAATNLRIAFSMQIIEEIWGQAETTSRGEATALTFSKIYAQAVAILEKRIHMIDGPMGIAQKEENLIIQQCKLADLEEDYENGYGQNYDRINTVRKNIVAIQNSINELQKNREDFQKELNELNACLHVEDGVDMPTVERSQIVHSRLEESIPEGPSADLSLIFKGSVAGVCLQMAFLNYHPAFLPLLAYLLIVNWLFLGYYDQYFVKTLMLGLIVSCLMDVAYACLVFVDNIGSHRFYNQSNIWRYISVAFLFLEFALRGFLIYKLSIFRQPTARREYFTIYNYQIELKTRSGKVFSNAFNRD